MSSASPFANGVLIHAAAVKTPRGALMFLGKSGAGKSTICRLLSPQFEPISDDTVYVGPDRNGRWLVDRGLPYMAFARGITRMPQVWDMAPVPIHGIMRLCKGERPAINPMSARLLCLHLMRGILEIRGQSSLYNSVKGLRWFGLAALIAREVPGWRLRFTQGSDSLLLIRAFVMEGRTDGCMCRGDAC